MNTVTQVVEQLKEDVRKLESNVEKLLNEFDKKYEGVVLKDVNVYRNDNPGGFFMKVVASIKIKGLQ